MYSSFLYSSFFDDGQRIVVHADKRKLAGLTFFLAIIVAVATLMLFIPKMPWFMLVLLIAFIGLIALTALLCAVRLALPGSTLVIDQDGLRDNSSVFTFGRGLIHWDEILNVFVFVTKSRSITHRYFAVLLTDGKAVQRRMPTWQRLLALPFSLMGPDMFVITRSLLDRPPDELVTEIKRYVAEHAPKGWSSPLLENVDEWKN